MKDYVRRFLSSQSVLQFSYGEVGASREGVLPKGYAVDRYRVRLGEGEKAYERAIKALRERRPFDLEWGYASSRSKRPSRLARRSAHSLVTTASGP
ncbi:MAG TPA: DUF1990 family protein [Rubrobacteraceae bacterium]|nr:DUF1990 family protein [Rubrobacteraceae bacterium]